MEFVEGDHLRRIILNNGKLAGEGSRDYSPGLLALTQPGAGIIHRDLKPQNIIQEGRRAASW
jgi:serine/threonine protein kinase